MPLSWLQIKRDVLNLFSFQVPMKVAIINNAENGISDFTRPIESILKDAQIQSETIDYDLSSKVEQGDYDAVILSGSPYGNDIVEHHSMHYQWILDTTKPILGICAGHHIVGNLFGAPLVRDREGESGECLIIIDVMDPFFNGYNEQFLARQHHKDAIVLPDNFILLAHSELCSV